MKTFCTLAFTAFVGVSAVAMTTSASVPKRRLGKTDMEITPVGIGAFARFRVPASRRQESEREDRREEDRALSQSPHARSFRYFF